MKIEKFLCLYPKKNTRGVYQAGIYEFFDCVYGKVRKGKRVTNVEKETYETISERYFTEQRDYLEDMLKFAAYMNGQPPIGARAKIAGVKEFLGNYGVEFTQRQLKQMSTKMPKGKTARTAEKDVYTETLRKILSHMDLKGKTVVLVLASSGMRIGEILQVKLSDVDLTSTPPEMVVRGEYTKSGDTRTVFISNEAKEALNEWLKVRDSYLKSALNRNKGLVEKGEAKGKTINDNRLFPFSDKNVRVMWENALKKAGLWNKDNTTGRSQVRIHALRKFFRSQLALSCPVDIVEALMGHEGYLTEAYRRYSRKQMGEYYLRAEHHVTIMGSGDIREIQDRLQDTQAAVKGYKDIISELVEDIAKLGQNYERLEGELEAMKARETEKEPIDDIMSRLMSDPDVQKLLKKKLGDLMDG